MTIDEVLYLLSAKWQKLLPVQELILRQAWEGNTYASMAQASHYEADYIRNVASQLWRSLSELFGEPISKANFRSLLKVRSFTSEQKRLVENPVRPSHSTTPLEFPSGSVPLNSSFYVERPPAETLAFAEIAKPGSLIQIKAPRRMGKSSLLLRINARAVSQGYRTVTVDFQRTDANILANLDTFLRWFCTNISWQLSLEPKLDDYWNETLGSKVSCTIYLQHYLLAQSDAPLVLTLSELNELFEYDRLTRDLLQLLRSWHEEAKQVQALQKLRLIVACSSEICAPLQIQPSFFNVGLPIKLPEFNLEQVQELALRYGLSWSEGSQARQLMALLGGHPYLLRIAFYRLCQEEMELGEILRTAPTFTGIYGEHLQSCWTTIQAEPRLVTTLRQILLNEDNIQADPTAIHKLKRMGLVKMENDRAIASCELYRLYFEAQLSQYDFPSNPFLAENISGSTTFPADLYESLKQVEQDNPELQGSCGLDELTRLANRSSLIEQLQQEWRFLAQKMAPLSLILCDLDCFRSYNNLYGRQAGDVCLQRVARAICQVLKRPDDLVARYAGTTFAVLLSQTDGNSALQIAVKIQSQVKLLSVPYPASPLSAAVVTLSVGVASIVPNFQKSPAVLMAAASQALLRAKREGCDRATLQKL